MHVLIDEGRERMMYVRDIPSGRFFRLHDALWLRLANGAVNLTHHVPYFQYDEDVTKQRANVLPEQTRITLGAHPR